MTDPIKILFLTANPTTLARLRTDRDYRDVEEAIRRGLDRTRFEILPAPAARVRDLQDAVQRYRPKILHFSGHADSNGIALEDDAGSRVMVSGRALAGLFRLELGTIRLVVLSACESDSTAEAFHEFVDYTIGMGRKISDRAAIVFNTALYGKLADDLTIPRAFDYAVNALQCQCSDEADIPVLARRPGASDSLTTPPPAEQSSPGVINRFENVTVNGSVTTIVGDNDTVNTRYGMPKLR